MAVAITRTSSSPDSTSGTATSRSSKLSGPPNFLSTIAFIGHLLLADRTSAQGAPFRVPRSSIGPGCELRQASRVACLLAGRWSIRLLGIQTLALDPDGFLDLCAAVVSCALFRRLPEAGRRG